MHVTDESALKFGWRRKAETRLLKNQVHCASVRVNPIDNCYIGGLLAEDNTSRHCVKKHWVDSEATTSWRLRSEAVRIDQCRPHSREHGEAAAIQTDRPILGLGYFAQNRKVAPYIAEISL